MNPYEAIGIVMLALCGLPALGLAVLYLVWLVGRVVATADQTLFDELKGETDAKI